MFALLGFKENRKFLKKLEKKKRNLKNQHADFFCVHTIVIPGVKADSWWSIAFGIK